MRSRVKYNDTRNRKRSKGERERGKCQLVNERKTNDVVDEKRSSNLQLLLPFRLTAVASRFS